jgi:TRAP-type C4-dicarboxylate transport system substrate-binding protein
VSGELDLGLVATRAWEDAWVASLAALTTPFLITDEALVDDVVGGPIADELMSGLNKVGVVGVALIPEGLRHPFAFDTPLLGPDDHRGKVIAAPGSASARALFASPGATTNEDSPSPDEHAGADSSYVGH